MDHTLMKSNIKTIKKKGPEKGAIVHSDQGTQFTSPKYAQLLKSYQLTQSMSRRGNCWDIDCMDSFSGKLKTEIHGFHNTENEISSN